MGIWRSMAIMTVAGVAVTSAVLGLLVVVEQLTPRGRHPLRSRLRGAIFWAIYVPLSAVILTGLSSLWRALGVPPIARIELWTRLSGVGPAYPVIVGLTGIMATDFMGYWFHRIQHRLLWRFHAVHHSISEMHAVGSYDHPADIVFGFVLVAIPLSLFSLDAPSGGLIVQLLLAAHLKFSHASTRLSFGPLRRVIVDNVYHRIHHSPDPRHFGKNFGTITTIWDQLFGTAYFPEPGSWPQTGLAGVREPRSVREFLELPFRLKAGRQAPGDLPSEQGAPGLPTRALSGSAPAMLRPAP